MKTYQDFVEIGESEEKRMEFILDAIAEHKASGLYRTAVDADLYDRRQNVTIRNFQKLLYTVSGVAVPDNFSANHKMVSGFFPRFVTQQNQYLLGNGMTLKNAQNKAKLGADFDTKLQQLCRSALVGAVSFGFWDLDHMEYFQLLEFAPLWDEEDGSLKSGIRFWQVDNNKPLRTTLYEIDGYTEYIKRKDEDMEILHPKRKYIQVKTKSDVGGEQIRGGENYPGFPIIPMWGNPAKQSELVGVREAIDCYDLIKSGFANDIDDASMIYWTLENAGGMDDVDLAKFVERMKTVRAAVVDGDAGAKASAHTMDVPYEGRERMLDRIKTDLYEDFQIVDTRNLSSGDKTATEIETAYEPMDLKVNDFEYCVLSFLDSLFKIVGIDDSPSFIRSKITNQKEQVEMVLAAAPYLDDEIILKKLPFLTPEEVEALIKRKIADEGNRITLEDVTDDETA